MTAWYRPTTTQRARLRALAQQTGEKTASHIGRAIDAYLEEHEEATWAGAVIKDWESSNRATRPLSELVDELGV